MGRPETICPKCRLLEIVTKRPAFRRTYDLRRDCLGKYLESLASPISFQLSQLVERGFRVLERVAQQEVVGYLKAAVAEWYRYRIMACLVTSSSPVPLKIRRVGQRWTLNLSRAGTSSRWCGVVVRRGGASSGVVHVT
ncbi:uncharacterized protein TNCV_4252971 [Trichonephila clavipes]|nr:uncharacterized protein TNCV_4252971 [Trichonephila clavipes]